MEPTIENLVRQLTEAVRLPAAPGPDELVLATLLERFGTDTLNAQRDIQRLLDRRPERFVPPAFRALKRAGDCPGAAFLRGLLGQTGVLLEALADPGLVDTENAVKVVQALDGMDMALDVKLLQRALSEEASSGIDVVRARRVLELASNLPPRPRILPSVVKLLRHTDPRLRSKATALFCRASRNPQWVREKLSSADARVRANAVEALWGADSAPFRELLTLASRDQDHRVAANALVGLYCLGGENAAAQLEKMAANEAPLFRSAAGFAMGQTLDPVFVPTLSALVKDQDAAVRRQALRALIRIRKAEAGRAAAAPDLIGSEAQNAVSSTAAPPGGASDDVPIPPNGVPGDLPAAPAGTAEASEEVKAGEV